jgi:hypothetical protein
MSKALSRPDLETQKSRRAMFPGERAQPIQDCGEDRTDHTVLDSAKFSAFQI